MPNGGRIASPSRYPPPPPLCREEEAPPPPPDGSTLMLVNAPSWGALPRPLQQQRGGVHPETPLPRAPLWRRRCMARSRGRSEILSCPGILIETARSARGAIAGGGLGKGQGPAPPERALPTSTRTKYLVNGRTVGTPQKRRVQSRNGSGFVEWLLLIATRVFAHPGLLDPFRGVTTRGGAYEKSGTRVLMSRANSSQAVV